jgi:hypothetical protein
LEKVAPIDGQDDDIFSVKQELSSQLARVGPAEVERSPAMSVNEPSMSVRRLPSPDQTPRLPRFGARLLAGLVSPPAPAANWQAINAENATQSKKRTLSGNADDGASRDGCAESSALRKPDKKLRLLPKLASARSLVSSEKVKVEVADDLDLKPAVPLQRADSFAPAQPNAQSVKKPSATALAGARVRRDSMDSISDDDVGDIDDRNVDRAGEQPQGLTHSQEYRVNIRAIKIKRRLDREQRESMQR